MEQENQKKSDSALNSLLTARSNLRIGRFLISQGGRLVASAASTAISGLGLPLFITIIAIFVFTFFIVGFVGGPGGTGGTTPQPSQAPISLTPSIILSPSISPSQNLRQGIIDRFEITMNGGFDQTHLQWAWNTLQRVSNTRFIELIRGTTITAILGNGSEQTGCRSLNLSQYQSEELFSVVLIHELAHIIRNCSSRSQARWTDHLSVLANEGPVTNYARTACTGGTNTESEDYAEMITYYLNPGADAQTAACAGRQPNPYFNNAHPLHYNLVRQILGSFL